MKPTQYLNRQMRVEAVAAEILEQWRIYKLPLTVRVLANMHNIDPSYANRLLKEACRTWPKCLRLESQPRGNHTVLKAHWIGYEEPSCPVNTRWYPSRTAVLAWSQRRYEHESEN